MATYLRQIEANLKRQAEEEKAERAVRRAARVGGSGEEAATEGGVENQEPAAASPEAHAGQSPAEASWKPIENPKSKIKNGKVPELPEKFEGFLEIFCRAFPPPRPGPTAEGDQMLVRALAWAVWERLRVYEHQMAQEEARLRRVLDEVSGEAVESYKDLRKRSYLMEMTLATEPDLTPLIARREADIELAIYQLLRSQSPNLEQEVFPPPPGMPAPVSSTWSLAG